MQFSPSTSYFQIQALPSAATPSGTSSVRVLRLEREPEFYAFTDKNFYIAVLYVNTNNSELNVGIFRRI